jgi:hypothetical protein
VAAVGRLVMAIGAEALAAAPPTSPTRPGTSAVHRMSASSALALFVVRTRGAAARTETLEHKAVVCGLPTRQVREWAAVRPIDQVRIFSLLLFILLAVSFLLIFSVFQNNIFLEETFSRVF